MCIKNVFLFHLTLSPLSHTYNVRYGSYDVNHKVFLLHYQRARQYSSKPTKVVRKLNYSESVFYKPQNTWINYVCLMGNLYGKREVNLEHSARSWTGDDM